MRRKIRFRLKEDFNKFLEQVPAHLEIMTANEKRQTISVEGLDSEQEIASMERAYNAVISPDPQHGHPEPK